jgi:hypothetical protein
MIDLAPSETLIVGRWLMRDGRMVADAAALRIEALIAGPLIKVASAADGWTSLYVDPRDGRLWERRYDDGGLSGGGPPTLANVPPFEAARRYGYRPST